MVDSVIGTPSAPAARTVAISPSGCARRWYAIGATATGIASGWPSAVVVSDGWSTPTSMRGLSLTRSNAARLPRSVVSSPAPPA